MNINQVKVFRTQMALFNHLGVFYFLQADSHSFTPRYTIKARVTEEDHAGFVVGENFSATTIELLTVKRNID